MSVLNPVLVLPPKRIVCCPGLKGVSSVQHPSEMTGLVFPATEAQPVGSKALGGAFYVNEGERTR